MEPQEIFMAAFVDELEKLGAAPLLAPLLSAAGSGIAQAGASVGADAAIKALRPKKRPQASTGPLMS